MKPYPITAFYGNADVSFSAPSSVEEFDNAIGETGACLEGAIDDTIYRHTLPRLYSKVSEVLAAPEDKNGKAFPKAQATNKDGTPAVRTTKSKGDVPILESDMDHLRRFYEGKDDEGKASLILLLQSTAESLPFYDRTAPSAARGAGKVSKANLDAANGMIAAGSDRVEKVVAFIESTVPGYKVSREEDESVSAESLGRAIAALDRHEKAKALAARNAALAGL